jgi:hypothetical protein
LTAETVSPADVDPIPVVTTDRGINLAAYLHEVDVGGGDVGGAGGDGVMIGGGQM